MRTSLFLSIGCLLLAVGCATAGGTGVAPVLPDSTSATGERTHASSEPRFIGWGVYTLEIARDGSRWDVVNDRSASVSWGYHLNAVKLLETSPCANCLSLSNIHLLPNGDLSVDISIKHPYDNPVYTGFDVRGIIMFPASQYWPDNDLRVQAGFPPYNDGVKWLERYSSSEKGDCELMNPDGWTTIWAPDAKYNEGYYEPEEGFPIFEYYKGKFASGDDLGTLNAFKRFYSSENRHMFEVGETVSRTYIIRPPAEGPIEASYAVYAHWNEPLTIPVTDPAVDFGPEANSPMPYEFTITQDQPFDPDCPMDAPCNEHIIMTIKTWDIGPEEWNMQIHDLPFLQIGGGIDPIPDGEEDQYCPSYIDPGAYEAIPGALPGEWPFIFIFRISDPKDPSYHIIGTDFYIADIAIEEPDGEW